MSGNKLLDQARDVLRRNNYAYRDVQELLEYADVKTTKIYTT